MIGVLIVDDDRELVSSLEGEVSRMGYKTYVADSADAAIETMLNNQIEVMVTDLRMGRRDGIDLIKMAKQVSPKTRSILMSAYATARDYKVAVDLGAVDVLPKPFTPADLAQSIEKAVDCEEGFRGTVHGLSLTDIIQMFHFARRSLTIQIGAETNMIHMEDGEVTHAVAGAEEGKKALITLLQYRSGSVRTLPPVSCPRTIDVPFRGLLLDSLREIDENNRDGAEALATQPTDTGGTDGHVPAKQAPAKQESAKQEQRVQPVKSPVPKRASSSTPMPQEQILDFDNAVEDDLLSRAAPPPQLMRTESLADIKVAPSQRNRPTGQVAHAEDPARGARPTGPVAPRQSAHTGPSEPSPSRSGLAPMGSPGLNTAGSSPQGAGGLAGSETPSPAASAVVPNMPVAAAMPLATVQTPRSSRPSRVPLLLGMATGLVALMVIAVLMWLLWYQGEDQSVDDPGMAGPADQVEAQGDEQGQQARQTEGSAAGPGAGSNSANGAAGKARQITVSTKPPGLMMVDAKTLRRVGPSPVVAEVKRGAAPPIFKAMLGTQLSRPLTVPPDAARADFDLRRWAGQIRTAGKTGLAKARRRSKRAKGARGVPSAADGRSSSNESRTNSKPRLGRVAGEDNDRPALAPLDEDENAPNLGLID